MITIYLAQNIVNQKVYIGQTKNPLGDRISKHYSDAKCGYIKGQPFKHAINKYGTDKFKWFVLETLKDDVDEELIDDTETDWISYFDSTNPQKGYNVCLGGRLRLSPEREEVRVAALRKEVHQYDLNGVYIKTFKSALDACREYNDTGGILTKVARNHGYSKTAFGFRWSYQKYKILKFTTNKKRVSVFDFKSGNFIKTFESVSAASKFTTIPTNQISRCCKGVLNRGKEYKFEYAD